MNTDNEYSLSSDYPTNWFIASLSLTLRVFAHKHLFFFFHICYVWNTFYQDKIMQSNQRIYAHHMSKEASSI